MRKSLLLLALCVSASCSGDATGPAIADFAGPWRIDVQANPTCTGATAASSRYFTVETSSADNGAFNVVTGWDVVQPDRGFGWTVTGNFDVRARTVVLNFWSTTLVTGEVFTGTIRDDGSVVGTMVDPKPGYQPHFVIGTCTFQATGRRIN